MNAFNLIQRKHAIKLEAMGIKVASRSVRRDTCEMLDLPLNTPGDEVIQTIDFWLDQIKQGEVEDTGPEIIT